MSETLTFTPPVSVVEKTTASGNTFWTIEDAEGRQASTWSRQVAEHLRDAKEPVACEVEVKEKDGRKYRNVVSIPGVVEREKRNASRGPLLSDRQVAVIAGAILASSGASPLADAAAACLAWLAGSTTGTGGSSSPSAGRAGEDRLAGGDSIPTDLQEALAMAFPGRPALAERWLATKLREFVAETPEELTAEQLSQIVTELVQLAGKS